MTSTTFMTAAQLLELSPSLARAELIEGELRKYPYYGMQACLTVARIVAQLGLFVEENHLGVVGGSGAGFVLARNPDTVLSPAAVFISNSLLSCTAVSSEYFDGPPELVVEIEDTCEGAKDVELSINLWLAAGARMVWLINPRNRTATIYRPDVSPTMIDENSDLTGEDILPGFRLRLGEVLV